MIAARPPWTRPHRDLLLRLSSAWPWPCFLVHTGRGSRALVVTEVTADRELARVCGYAMATVARLQSEGLIMLGPIQVVPDYRGRAPIDTTLGSSVSITSAGCALIGAPTPQQRLAAQVTDAQRAALAMFVSRADV